MITDILSIIISAMALIMTFLFNKKQNEFNQNSVRPILQIEENDYEDNIGIQIENVGTGPLLITNVSFRNTETDEEGYVLVDMMPLISQLWRTFSGDIQGLTIPAGGRIVLLKLVSTSNKDRMSVRYVLSKIVVRIEYTDIYGKQFLKEQKLDYFERQLMHLKQKKF